MVGFENDSGGANCVFAPPQWWFAEKICLKNGQSKVSTNQLIIEGEETFWQATAEPTEEEHV
jgi:hypothetical protein